MLILRIQMVCAKSSWFLLWVILLICTSLVACSGHRKSADEVLLSEFVDPSDGKLDQDLAELLWIRCRQEFIQLKVDSEDLHCILEQGSIWNSPSKIKECNKFLQHSRENLLNCAHKNTNSFHASGASVDNYIKNSIPLSQATHIPRRSLLRSISMAPTPGSTVGSHAPAPAPSPEATSDPDVPSAAPKSGSSFFPSIDSHPPPPPPTAVDANSGPVSGPGDSGNGNRRTIVIAVTVTAAVTFVFAALFFLCCTKICRGARDRRNDERPLLSLSLSDYSIASSNKTFGYGSSIKEDNITSNANLKSESLHVPLEKHLPDGDIVAKLPAESSEMSGNHNPLVPLPAGRLVNNSSLRPPPGRTGTLPPEPPASLRPSLSMAGPSPSPPPKAEGGRAPKAPGPPPPPAPGMTLGAHPPPPPGLAPRPPPPAPFGSKAPRPPPGLKTPSSEGASSKGDPDAPKAKLKPFFWDKVLANPDNSMVWHQIKSGSFQFNEEMIEALFGAAPVDKNKNERKKESSSQDAAYQFVQILEPKKAQNLSIMLRALNVTIKEVCDALYEGNELPVEFLQNLIKMQPTTEEELKLRMYSGDLSQLGQAERFLKQLVDIPFAYKRLEALVFMCTLQEEVTAMKESFQTLEIACKELRSNRLFLKLLEAVLKTGNRMNDGTFRGGALAFKLDTLLKLADVKGTDGKTTLLHFVVQEIVRSEGVRAARIARESRSFSSVSVKTEDLIGEISADTEDHFRDLGLQVVSRVSTELGNVKKAAALDADNLTGTVVKLGQALVQTREFLKKEMGSLDENSGFHETLKSFVQNAEVDIKVLLEEEKRIMAVVKSAGDYFHGNAGKDEGLRLFVIVRDFLIILDRVCKEVGEAQKRRAKALKKEGSTASPAPSDNRMHPSPDLRQRLFPAIAERRPDDSDSSSDSET